MLANLIEYSKNNNVSISTTYENLFNGILNEKNMTDFRVNEITIRMLKKLNVTNDLGFVSDTQYEHLKGDWKNVIFLKEYFTTIYEASYKTNWSTNKIGTFFIKMLSMFYKNRNCKPLEKELVEATNNLFTFPDEEVSLMDMTYLLAMNDVEELTKNSPSLETVPGSVISIKASFLNCFKLIVGNTNTSEEVVREVYFDEKSIMIHEFDSPCLNTTKYSFCKDYCSWHQKIMGKWTKPKLLGVMKYALPQRKLVMTESEEELKLSEAIFGNDKTLRLNNPIVPMTSVVFCHRRSHGYSGDYIEEMDIRTCNDFFSTPNDMGIGLSQNMDVKKIIKNYKDYEKLFQAESQELKRNISGRNFQSEAVRWRWCAPRGFPEGKYGQRLRDRSKVA